MGSGYFGEPYLINERSGSSRKGKKNSNSEKPKQPQRGLGVAQLEKIRLHSQLGGSYLPSVYTPYPTSLNQEDARLQTTAYSSIPSSSFSSSSSSSYGFQGHQNIMMRFGESERANVTYGDSQPSTAVRWSPVNGVLETQHFAQPTTSTRQLLNLQVEDWRGGSMGSSSRNSETNDNQELDLELKLSL